jgi:predicted N-acetyltransferase YhbS
MTYALNFSANEFSPAVVIGGEAVATGPVIRIGDETLCDIAARENLLDEAFGPGRAEKTCERLREGRLPAAGLSLIAKDGEKLVGTLRLWHIEAGAGRAALLLGPLAVATSHRSLGLGALLICEALYRCVLGGHEAVLLVGDAPYYERFGFTRRLAEKLVMPGFVEKERFLGLELVAGALTGAAGAVVPTGNLEEPQLVPQAREFLLAA